MIEQPEDGCTGKAVLVHYQEILSIKGLNLVQIFFLTNITAQFFNLLKTEQTAVTE